MFLSTVLLSINSSSVMRRFTCRVVFSCGSVLECENVGGMIDETRTEDYKHYIVRDWEISLLTMTLTIYVNGEM